MAIVCLECKSVVRTIYPLAPKDDGIYSASVRPTDTMLTQVTSSFVQTGSERPPAHAGPGECLRALSSIRR